MENKSQNIRVCAKFGFILWCLIALTACGLQLPDPSLGFATPDTTVIIESSTATPDEPAPAIQELSCRDEEHLCIGLVTDVGGIDDKSFNQSAWEGVLRAKRDLAAEIEFAQPTEASQYTQKIEYFAQKDYDVIITVGFNLGTSTRIASEKYPHIDFIGVDQNQGGFDIVPNRVGLIFSEKKAGFLAGALAALVSETGTIGAVLGTDQVPPVVAFKEGYEIGAYAINPNINVLSEYHPGGVSKAFIDAEWGAEVANEMITSGADVIFGAGGLTGNGALVEAAGQDDVFCIGVDTDQWFTVTEAQPCIISSAEKLIDEGVFELIAWSFIGDPKQGNFLGNVDLAPFHSFEDDFSAEATAFLLEIKEALENDEIPLDGSFVYEDPPFVTIDR